MEDQRYFNNTKQHNKRQINQITINLLLIDNIDIKINNFI